MRVARSIRSPAKTLLELIVEFRFVHAGAVGSVVATTWRTTSTGRRTRLAPCR